MSKRGECGKNDLPRGPQGKQEKGGGGLAIRTCREGKLWLPWLFSGVHEGTRKSIRMRSNRGIQERLNAWVKKGKKGGEMTCFPSCSKEKEERKKKSRRRAERGTEGDYHARAPPRLVFCGGWVFFGGACQLKIRRKEGTT